MNGIILLIYCKLVANHFGWTANENHVKNNTFVNVDYFIPNQVHIK